MSKFQVLLRSDEILVVGFRNYLGREMRNFFSGVSRTTGALEGEASRIPFLANGSAISPPKICLLYVSEATRTGPSFWI